MAELVDLPATGLAIAMAGRRAGLKCIEYVLCIRN